jgi:hypothetical protein
MNGFFRVVTVEGLKLRRTLAFRLAVLAPLFIVILQFTIELVRASEESGASPGLNPLRACFENRSGRGLRARRGECPVLSPSVPSAKSVVSLPALSEEI